MSPLRRLRLVSLDSPRLFSFLMQYWSIQQRFVDAICPSGPTRQRTPRERKRPHAEFGSDGAARLYNEASILVPVYQTMCFSEATCLATAYAALPSTKRSVFVAGWRPTFEIRAFPASMWHIVAFFFQNGKSALFINIARGRVRLWLAQEPCCPALGVSSRPNHAGEPPRRRAAPPPDRRQRDC